MVVDNGNPEVYSVSLTRSFVRITVTGIDGSRRNYYTWTVASHLPNARGNSGCPTDLIGGS